ncbi:hypothetical protein DSCA_53160 [Desulfosarcina alkanivorans]|uniref:HEPN AbiU2-like domain-containing protein n=1 Tax=Desulfosarcina alkanivorans TaxID=571177 RepID=A0A5K7YQ59_9BACT|nr:hypothetical protein [Desulfosarcina alkanivorans]BBO71386.1 hypothetical protein DSCA_53160 [Desulfosarcina alkanivorans]
MQTYKLEIALKELYSQVFRIVQNIHFYKEMFMSDFNVELLNDKAPLALNIIQVTLANDIMSSIFRLLDPLKSCGEDNLTLFILKEPLKEINGTSQEFEKLEAIKKNYKNYRHKILSHNDLNRVISFDDSERIIFPWKAIEEFSEASSKIIKYAYLSLLKTEVSFDIDYDIGEKLLKSLGA